MRRTESWCDVFFSILEREKRNRAPSFRKVVEEIACKTGRLEASFSSKLVATIDPCLPIWDRHVLDNLALRAPYSGMERSRRVCRCDELYSRIAEWTETVVHLDRFEEWKTRFDRAFPRFTSFAEVKKLDLYLWQSR